jgi:tetratricopeptide (TPR) repeat protein
MSINELSNQLEQFEKEANYFGAIKVLEQLIELDPELLELHYNLGLSCLKVGWVERAETAFRYCIEEYYEDPLVHLNLGHALKAQGRSEEAAACYRRLVDSQNDSHAGIGYWQLADLKDYRFDDKALERLLERLSTLQAKPGYRGLMLYALGVALEQHSDYEKAFSAMAEANLILAMHRPFKADLYGQLISMLVKEVGRPAAPPCKHGPAPIFIVGLPRSGTTLVEQILASHSAVEPTDELPYLEYIGVDLDQSGGYAAALGRITPEQQEEFAKRYLDKVAAYFEEQPAYFIDKNPSNFLHIGLIKALFPDAKIINMVRDPLDNAMSVFKQYFDRGHEFSYSMQGIIYYLQGYVTLMRHWEQLYPGEILHLGYESLVSDPEKKITEILQYCGLEVEPACFRFYESDRPVLTPSVSQVRSPITARSVGSGEKYEPFIKPHIPALAEIKRKEREVLGV